MDTQTGKGPASRAAKAKEVAGQRMSGSSRRKRSQRREHIFWGKLLVLSSLGCAALYYLAVLVVTYADWRLGYRADDSVRYFSTATIVTVLVVLALALTIGAYRGHPAMRHLYLILNCVGGLLGVLWLTVRYASEAVTAWALFDLAGIAIAFFVAWVFYLSLNAQKFFREQLMTVKRK